jgi:hypothetical protein
VPAALSRHDHALPYSFRCSLESNEIRNKNMTNLVADLLRVNKLVLKIASWVASAMLRRVELWDGNLVVPPGLAARAAVLAFGDELVDLRLRPYDTFSPWLSKGGREMAASYLLPRAEAALRQELQRLADAVKLARAGERSSSTVSHALYPATKN